MPINYDIEYPKLQQEVLQLRAEVERLKWIISGMEMASGLSRSDFVWPYGSQVTVYGIKESEGDGDG